MNANDLSHPIPRDAPMPRWSHYQSFPTFSWSWCVRRAQVFWPLAIVYGMGFGAWHASGMNAWADWPGLALRACAGALLAVSAGPALAALVRHSRLPLLVERVLVVAAILAGLAIAARAIEWVAAYHDAIMAINTSHTMRPAYVFVLLYRLLSVSLNASTVVLAGAAGGFAMFSYLGEKSRLDAYASARELDALRRQKDEAELRLSVLQAQVEPHFLFNTLASVRSLVASDPQRAAATIDAMADYFRSTLPSLGQAGVKNATLGKQIGICLRYLDLMNIRTNDRIAIEVDVDEATRALFFPPLILLSLVENAVKHGVGPKPGPGVIAVRAHLRSDGGLEVAIEDDGAGLRTGESHGLGLANARAQLRNLFGSGASLSISSRAQGGTCAMITIERPAP
jgi:two-component sensor histidine kinase